jgi:hypothetical protein
MRMIVTNVNNSVDQSFGVIKTDLCKRLERNYADVEARLAGGFEEYMREELEPVIKVFSEPTAAKIDKAQTTALLSTARGHETAVSAVIC